VVGEEACLGEARDGGAMSTAAGGDDSAPEAKGGPVDRDGARTREAPLAQEDIHAEAAEPCRRIVETDAGADGAHALHHGAEVNLHGTGHVNAERQSPRAARRQRGGTKPPPPPAPTPVGATPPGPDRPRRGHRGPPARPPPPPSPGRLCLRR